jgi:hypothetical protein
VAGVDAVEWEDFTSSHVDKLLGSRNAQRLWEHTLDEECSEQNRCLLERVEPVVLNQLLLRTSSGSPEMVDTLAVDIQFSWPPSTPYR